MSHPCAIWINPALHVTSGTRHTGIIHPTDALSTQLQSDPLAAAVLTLHCTDRHHKHLAAAAESLSHITALLG